MFYRILFILFPISLISCTKEIIQQKLTVSVTPANGGSVSPPSNSYEKGSNVSLVATPSGEYLFKQWQGSISGTSNPTSITMDADKSVTGVFEKRQYPLTLTIEGSGTVKEEVIALATQSQYPSGTTVRLTAQPADKFEFGGWSGDLTSTANPLDLKIDKAISLKALFQQVKFPGYKVNTSLLKKSRLKDFGKSYWKNTPIVPDIIAYAFQKPKEKTFLSQGLMGLVCGDFNNDGWIDVYNLGAKTKTGAQENTMFLLWNPKTNVFDNVNLFNDKSIQAVSGGQVIPVYLNQDDYVDIVVISEGMFDDSPPPPRIILSDGKGGYDLKDIPIDLHPELISGDVGDIDGDGSPELVICGNFITYIFKGIKVFPYFQQQGGATFFSEKSSPYWYWDKYKNDNGFGVKSEIAVGAFSCEIDDVNGDGQNDLILSASENMKDYPTPTKVMINQGKGYFDDKNVIKLPLIGDGNQLFGNEDFIVDDVNGDGLNDIIALNTNQVNKWDVIAYVQQSKGNFIIDKSIFQYSINSSRKGNWKSVIIYQDFNNDGKKDLTYHDDASGIGNDNTLPFKSVFIKKGNQFVEENYFLYDDFMKTLLPLLTK